MNPQLFTLEGDNLQSSLELLPETKESRNGSYLLFGEGENSTRRIKVTLEGDYIEGVEYSPLYRTFVPTNEGRLEASDSWLQGADGIYWHADENGFLLGCSVCISDETLGDDSTQAIAHFHLDGTLAGVSIPNQNIDM